MKDKYNILEKLDEDLFGNSFKVLNNQDQKEYIIKEINLPDKEEEKLKIENEVKLLLEINNENVIKYYESFIENSKYYLVMEYCDADTLTNFINYFKTEKKTIPKKIILDFVGQICLGIKEIHNHNIIHKDLKPDNIFLTKDLKIKIGNFGIEINKKYDSVIYISPEIIQGEEYTNKTDIFSIGCILYELYTLDYIFTSIDQLSNKNIIKEKLIKIDSPELKKLINLLLEKNPLKRPNIDFIIDEIKKCQIIYENSEYKLEDILDILLDPQEHLQEEIFNINIENNIQQTIKNQSSFNVIKEKFTLKKFLVSFGLGILCGGFSILVPGSFTWILIGTSFGHGFIGGFFVRKKINFIMENFDIVVKIQNDLMEDIKKEINLKKIEEDKIIILTDEKFNERINITKEKFKEEKYKNKLKKKLENNLNIVLLGNTNAGKSTLINSFLKLSDDKKAKEGEGIPTNTIDFITYENEVNGYHYILHDTNGITNTGEHCISNKMERVEKEIINRLKKGKANNLIHCIWYCIAGPNVQDSDKELIQKLHNIYTTKQIPIIFIHTQTYSKIASKKARAGLEKYLTEIYNNNKKEAEDYLNKYYIETLAKDYELEYEDEETGEIKIKIRKPYGLDELEKLSRKEIKENGIKSAYFEYLKKDMIPILINAMYTQVFTEKNIKELGKASGNDIQNFLKVLIKIINESDPELNQETKDNNKKSIENIYKEFINTANKLYDILKNKLKKNNLGIFYNDFIEDYYNSKPTDYKNKCSLEKFKKKVSSKIYDNLEKNHKEIINNLVNHSFYSYIMEKLKNGLKIQLAPKEEDILNEIYNELLKD